MQCAERMLIKFGVAHLAAFRCNAKVSCGHENWMEDRRQSPFVFLESDATSASVGYVVTLVLGFCLLA